MMKRLAELAVICCVLCACGGSGDSDDGAANNGAGNSTAAGDPAGAVQKTVEVVDQIPLALSETLASARTISLNLENSVTVSCSDGGSAEITGGAVIDTAAAQRSFSYEFAADFLGCSGLEGSVQGTGSGARQGAAMQRSVVFSGALSDDSCSYVMSSIETNTTVDYAAGTSMGMVSGQVTADCGGTHVFCSWSGARLGDQEALRAGCEETAF